MQYLADLQTPSVFFSDLHAKKDPNDRLRLLENFLQTEQAKNSKQIFLLGDIFDLMIGQHDVYFIQYKKYFDLIAEHVKNGTEVYYFQGNHDFHLKKLYEKFKKNYQIDKNFHLIDGPALFRYQDKTIYLSHGDELDVENHSYQRYKKIIRSNFAKLVAERIVSENTLNSIAEFLAKKSKNKQRNFDWNKSFLQYRSYIQKLWDSGIQGVIVGHSHVCDAWEEGIHFYYNVGYAPQEKQFLYLNEDGLQFVPLE